LTVATGLEEGLELGKAILRVVGTVKQDRNKYDALYRLFSVDEVAHYWRGVARAFKGGEQIDELIRTGEFTRDPEELMRRKP